MAALPPRKNPTPTKLSKQSLTPLQTLLQMGIAKHRADKALAATGNRGSVQLASDWLLAHVNDPYLDDSTPRDYILYACPTGPFQQKLEEFWAKSRELCGWNGAHNYMPHITLVSFFKSPDDSAAKLSKSVVEFAQSNSSPTLQMELYISNNFMGFFVGEDDANFLKRIALQFVKEVSDSTISLDPHVKSLHLTLAYQFPSEQFNALKALVEQLDPTTATSWELRLYSRDQRLATRQVHKIIYPYAAPTEADELELIMGDYVYLNADSLHNSTDGWVEGISWLTGTSGFLPINYTERCAESEAWVNHRAVSLFNSSSRNDPLPDPRLQISDIDSDFVDCGKGGTSLPASHDYEPDEPRDQDSDDQSSTVLRILTEKPDPSEVYRLLSEKSISYDLNPSTSPSSISKKKPVPAVRMNSAKNNVTRIFVMRHGERVDFTFGNWLPYCFDGVTGRYVQEDLNMPQVLPERRNVPQGWEKDSPLTNVGVFQAQTVGEALRRNGIRIDRAYVSPAFRCVSTCSGVLEGLGQKDTVLLNVEPGLFEWCIWHKSSGLAAFDWLTVEELAQSGLQVNREYEPWMSVKEVEECLEESLEEFWERNGKTLDKIVEQSSGENILIVGHACTLEVAHQRLVSGEMRTMAQVNRLMHKVSYCSLIALEKDSSKANKWALVEDGIYSMTHTANQRFDASVLMK